MSPSSGSGTGTPVAPGSPPIPGGTPVVEPFPYTLLSIHRWAKVMGITPLHFAGAITPGLNPMVMPAEGSCGSIWHKYDWQAFDQVSQMQIADLIHEAEQDIARFLGYYPAPMFIADDNRPYPRPYLKPFFGNGVSLRGSLKTIKASYGKIISTGQRSVTLVGTATVAGGALVYSDPDGDGFAELATITLATALTDPQEIKLYFTGYSGQLEWEVRPLDVVSISGGTLTIQLDSWLLIEPELYDAYPTSDGTEAIDVSTTANFVAAVDVYREVISPTVRSAQFTWEGVYVPCDEVGVDACDGLSQDGCALVRDAHAGMIVPIPSAYSDSSGAWESADWTGTREPDSVKLWYYAGERSQAFLRGTTNDPLSVEWARLIAYLAAARLERPPCACGNIVSLHEWLAEDVSMSVPGRSFFVPQNILDNPFGTRRGEIMAWRKLSRNVRDRVLSSTIV